jgi:hypothetical protein
VNIHQINVGYQVEHDRLLIRINSQSGEEFRVWLTRRLSLQLLPILERSGQDQLQAQIAEPNPAAPPHEQRQQLVRNFQKEAQAYQGDYQTPFRDQATALPLGQEPLLVTELQMTSLAEGKLQVSLLEKLPQRQRDMQLVMDVTLTQGLTELLRRAIQASEWLKGLDPKASPAIGTDPPEGDARANKPRYLN